MCEFDEEEAILLALLLDEEAHNKQKKRRTVWVHDINKKRKEEGEFHRLYPYLRKDSDRFYTYFRMDSGSFDEILNLIRNDITKQHSTYREPIGAEERLAVTLRFLATGDSYNTIGHSFRIGFSTVRLIVEEVCTAIWNRLQPIYMPHPTRDIWEKSISGYENLWQFPNCLGSIDGKHITIKCPKNSGSNYFSYLKKFSIVLMAIVDPEYKFICIDVGAYGKNSDGGIFEASSMGRRFENGSFDIPPSRTLPGGNEEVPCILIGDEAFTLSSFLMRPFPYRQSRHNHNKEKFNYHLCRARRVVENAFGMLVHKWRLFFRPIEVKVETARKLVKTACVLHNFLREKKIDEKFLHLGTNINDMPVYGHALGDLSVDGRRATNQAFMIREKFVDYFINL